MHSNRPGASPPRMRVGPLAVALRAFSVLAIMMALAICLVTLISGTYTLDSGDKRRIGMADMSIVRFEGVVHDKAKGGDNYLATMHWFLGAFGWEYPSAANKDHTAGLIYSGPGRTLRLPEHLTDIALRVGLNASEYECAKSHHTGGTCSGNPFFDNFRHSRDTHRTTSVVAWIFVVYDMFLLLWVLGIEVISTVRKPWLRCRCCVLGGMCGCPKGTAAEIEALPPPFWDRFRMWYHVVALISVTASAVFATVYGGLLIGFLRSRNVRSARFGARFMAMAWGGVAAVAAGCAAIFARRRINEKALREMQIRGMEETQQQQGRMHHRGEWTSERVYGAEPPPYRRPSSSSEGNAGKEGRLGKQPEFSPISF